MDDYTLGVMRIPGINVLILACARVILLLPDNIHRPVIARMASAILPAMCGSGLRHGLNPAQRNPSQPRLCGVAHGPANH